MARGLRRVLAAFALALALFAPVRLVLAAEESPAGTGELVVATKEAPPFSFKDEHGNWSGISIDLWRRVAEKLKLQYHLVDAGSVSNQIEGVASGNYDVAVAAITVTPAREQKVDFSVPYFHAGTGVAVQPDRMATWMPVIRSLASYSFLQAALGLLGLTLFVGILMWLFERSANEWFGGGPTRGVCSGVLWSANTMTQRTTEGAAPTTLPGRIVAILWMVISIVAIAVFTAGITSALTTKRLHGVVNAVADLSTVRVGTVEGTETENALSRLRVRYRKIPSTTQGFEALRDGTIDAFAYDRPILAWMIRQGSLSAELTDVTFDPQNYAIALRSDAALRKQINVELLKAEQSDWWKDTLFRYLGQQ